MLSDPGFPEMQEPIRQTIVEMNGRGWQTGIVGDPLRTSEEQAAKYAAGVSNCLHDCKHLDQGGTGAAAVDIIDKRWGQTVMNSESDRFRNELGAVGKSNGLGWGGDFKESVILQGWDKHHLELP